ncbi:hypothetical protein CI610_03037 [invertebrate metagenome]|uniref:Uncharacterized protein n=1 Tax=invertebrate metagenome TaxID=1711999 RepID=A0A2H9T482_9ZZZZ
MYHWLLEREVNYLMSLYENQLNLKNRESTCDKNSMHNPEHNLLLIEDMQDIQLGFGYFAILSNNCGLRYLFKCKISSSSLYILQQYTNLR